MPISNPITAPTTTPVISPGTQPWHETYTSPDRICPQQVREGASPDIEP